MLIDETLSDFHSKAHEDRHVARDWKAFLKTEEENARGVVRELIVRPYQLANHFFLGTVTYEL